MSTEPRVLADRYRVDEVIGHGGMATVFRGYDLTLGRHVAIKILNGDLARDASFRSRFRLEAQAASRMAHPAIVRVFDAGEDVDVAADGSEAPVPFIVMELVQGQLLKDIIAEGAVSQADAVRYVDGILEAVEYSHRAGVVHRDIKPGNVMVTRHGQIKVMDFGIARAVSDASATVAETTSILGTAAYFSPEQAKGEPVDGRADIYSTGVVLYELLAGRQPFRGDTAVAVAYQHVSEAPRRPSEINDQVSASFDEVTLRAMAKDPFQRFQDAAAFREALDHAVDGKPPTNRQVQALTSELYGPSPRQAAETARSLRQLSTDTTMTRTQSGPPVAWIWAGLGVITVLLIAVLFWVLSLRPEAPVSPSVREVPSVVGLSEAHALDVLGDLDLIADPILDEPSADVEVGYVTRTVPAAGETVTTDQTITVYVSLGIERTDMPSLTGMTLDEATAAIDAAGLNLGLVRRQNDPAGRENIVLSADQTAGSQVPVGSTVNLTVATGNVTLVNVRGYTLAAATRELEDLQLTVLHAENAECTASVGEPTVWTQSLAPGNVPVFSEVTLTYCTGE